MMNANNPYIYQELFLALFIFLHFTLLEGLRRAHRLRAYGVQADSPSPFFWLLVSAYLEAPSK